MKLEKYRVLTVDEHLSDIEQWIDESALSAGDLLDFIESELKAPLSVQSDENAKAWTDPWCHDRIPSYEDRLGIARQNWNNRLAAVHVLRFRTL